MIRGILDSWDPCGKVGIEHWYPLFYNYEAETIAQRLRKNSSAVTVANHIKELIDDKLEAEGLEYRVDDENTKRVAESMIEAVKRMR